MHPILARGSRLALYLAVWIIVGLLLAALLAGPGGLATVDALAIALPIAIAYAFFCLSAWYVARSTPHRADRSGTPDRHGADLVGDFQRRVAGSCPRVARDASPEAASSRQLACSRQYGR